jgi:hypothetical protein
MAACHISQLRRCWQRYGCVCCRAARCHPAMCEGCAAASPAAWAHLRVPAWLRAPAPGLRSGVRRSQAALTRTQTRIEAVYRRIAPVFGGCWAHQCKALRCKADWGGGFHHAHGSHNTISLVDPVAQIHTLVGAGAGAAGAGAAPLLESSRSCATRGRRAGTSPLPPLPGSDGAWPWPCIRFRGGPTRSPSPAISDLPCLPIGALPSSPWSSLKAAPAAPSGGTAASKPRPAPAAPALPLLPPPPSPPSLPPPPLPPPRPSPL